MASGSRPSTNNVVRIPPSATASFDASPWWIAEPSFLNSELSGSSNFQSTNLERFIRGEPPSPSMLDLPPASWLNDAQIIETSHFPDLMDAQPLSTRDQRRTTYNQTENEIQDIMNDLDTDDDTHGYKKSCIAELKLREKVESKYQARRFGIYLDYLKELENEVDTFLQTEERGDLNEQMIRFARHPWCYNRLGLNQRRRITKLRSIVEEKEEKNITNERNFWHRVNADTNNCNRPICSICLMDLRVDHFMLFALSCNHVFHEKCIKDQFRRHHIKKCGICNKKSLLKQGRRIFLSYE